MTERASQGTVSTAGRSLACGSPVFPIGGYVCYDPAFTVALGWAGPTRPEHKEEIMAGKKAGSVFDISALFEQELKARNEDLRRQAALSMLPKLRPSARVTMAEFLDSLQQHREVWSAVLEMPAVEFGALIAGGLRTEAAKAPAEPTKRTRISDAQKNSLKGAIVSVLGNHKDGLSRTDIAGQIGDDVLATIGVKRDELANKLRQPLGELVGDNKIHSVGEKRLMRYHAGAKKSRDPQW